jgi:hypothetical protein
MTNIIGVSSDHLKSCNESYFKHLLFAGRTGATMIAAGLACMAHGILPGLFETTGSRTIKALAARFTHRGAPPEPARAASRA